MKTSLIIMVVAAVLLVGFIAGYVVLSKPSATTPQQTAPSPTSIQPDESANADSEIRQGLIEAEIVNFAFVPSEIKIKVGSKITWFNKDNSPHTVTSDSGGKAELNSGILDSGESYGHVFNTIGTFNYHCNFHNDMSGQVIVVE